MIDALSNAREALQERSKSPLLRVDSDLPLPLAWLIGYEWRITTGLRLEFRQRTGSLFAWIAADGPVAEGPRVRDRIFDRNGPDVIAVSCKNSFDDHARRYAEEVSACRLVTLHRPGLLDHGEIRALARATADELRASNERNTNKHLLVLGPTSLVAMIGAASNACGPVTIPFWNGSRYVSPTTMGN
ncbi:MAG: SAVED domain-containing protein [Rubrobacteraceae bacterium]